MTSHLRARIIGAVAAALGAAVPLAASPLPAEAVTVARAGLSVTCSFESSSWTWYTSDDRVRAYTCAKPQPAPIDPED